MIRGCDQVDRRCGFSPWQRVRRPNEFSRILKHVRPVSAKRFQIYCCHVGLDYPRLGVIVGKRVLKRAVDRNYVKRIVRESFRQLSMRLIPNDYVIRLRSQKRLSRAALEFIRTEVDTLLSRYIQQT